MAPLTPNSMLAPGGKLRPRVWLAYALRRLAASRITNFLYDDDAATLQHVFRGDDTIHRLHMVAWGHYHDVHEHRLCLTRDQRRIFARMILLLRTGGEARRLRWFEKPDAYWPFASANDLAFAKSQPTYLCGRTPAQC